MKRALVSVKQKALPCSIPPRQVEDNARSDLVSDLIQLAIVPVPVENPGELHDLRLFVNRIDEPVFALSDPESLKTSIGEV